MVSIAMPRVNEQTLDDVRKELEEMDLGIDFSTVQVEYLKQGEMPDYFYMNGRVLEIGSVGGLFNDWMTYTVERVVLRIE